MKPIQHYVLLSAIFLGLLLSSGCINTKSSKRDAHLVTNACLEPVFANQVNGACFESAITSDEKRRVSHSPTTGHKKEAYTCQVSQNSKKFHILNIIRISHKNKTIENAFISRVDFKNGEPSAQTNLGTELVETVKFTCKGQWKRYVKQSWQLLNQYGVVPFGENGIIGEEQCGAERRRYPYSQTFRKKLKNSFNILSKHCSTEKRALRSHFVTLIR